MLGDNLLLCQKPEVGHKSSRDALECDVGSGSSSDDNIDLAAFAKPIFSVSREQNWINQCSHLSSCIGMRLFLLKLDMVVVKPMLNISLNFCPGANLTETE